MSASSRTFKRPSPVAALLAAAALLLVSSSQPPVREIAADTPGSQVVDNIKWVHDQVDFLTNGMTDWQLYSAGNLLFWGATATALASAYTWRKTLVSPWMRVARTRQILALNAELRKRLDAAGTSNFEGARDQLRKHIPTLPPGTPHRREILQAAHADPSALAMLLSVRPEVKTALENAPDGKAWLDKYHQHVNLVRDAQTLELSAKGILFDEAATRLVDHFAKSKTPPGLPFGADFRAIDTPEKLQKWMDRPEVQNFLRSPRTDVHAWQNELVKLINEEHAAFQSMQKQYRDIATDVIKHLETVNAKASGMAYMVRLVQPQLKFELDRYPNEKFGSFWTLNDNHVGTAPNGRRILEALTHLEKPARNVDQSARMEGGLACWQRFEAFAIGGSALLAGTVGWLMRDASNRRLENTTGKTGDQHVADGKKREKEEGDARSRDATDPPAVAKRLAEARGRGDETELRDLYALLRKILRDKENLPKIAEAIRNGGLASKEALSAGKFDEKLQGFLKDNDAADAVIDAAIAEATRNNASDVSTIKALLLGDDKSNAPFREKAHTMLYPTIVKSLWPSIVLDTAYIHFTERDAKGRVINPFDRMVTQTAPELEAIGARYRARPPEPRPTDPFRKP